MVGNQKKCGHDVEMFERTKVYKLTREVFSDENIAYKYSRLEFGELLDGDFKTARRVRILTGPNKGIHLPRCLDYHNDSANYSAYFGDEEVKYNIKSYNWLGVKNGDDHLISDVELQKLADETNEKRIYFARKQAVKKEIELEFGEDE